ncbi:MAG: hypothetical protein ACE3JP_15025 [Ectobacillus sp.]
MLWKKKEDERKRQSVQQLIPVQALDGGIIVTEDFRLVQPLRVSSFNLDLMSHRELNETMERYELFLRSLSFPVQTTIASQPVDLGCYVRSLEEKLDGTKSIKQNLLRGYIAYARGIETNATMIQRQRYIIIAEAVTGTTKQAYEESMLQLEQKKRHIKSGLEEIGLSVQEVHDLDVARYLHTLFDYASSQHRSIQDTAMNLVTVRGRAHVPAES